MYVLGVILIQFCGLVATAEKNSLFPSTEYGTIVNTMMPAVPGTGEDEGLSVLTARTILLKAVV